MARTPKGSPPNYPKKPHRGMARITVRLIDGRRHDIQLGPFGSAQSWTEYRRVLAELEVNGGRFHIMNDGAAATGLTVSELCLRFWDHAENFYRLPDGSPSRELEHYQYSLKPVDEFYGSTLASEFGPLKLKTVRQKMIDGLRYQVRLIDGEKSRSWWVGEDRIRHPVGKPDQWEVKSGETWVPVEVVNTKKALCRKIINQRIDHIKRFFKWAVSEELLPSSVYEALRTVAGLRRGHPGTCERARVKPVPQEHVEAVLPFLPPQVAAMIQLQPLMGARPTEICQIRGRSIDRTGPVWWYKIDPNEVARDGQPENLHKTAYQENADGSAVVKLLPIGPRAQAILKPWLRESPDEYLFQPGEARQVKYQERRKKRKNTLWPSHLAHQAKKKKTKPKRVPSHRYDRHSYARAIARACKSAGVPHWQLVTVRITSEIKQVGNLLLGVIARPLHKLGIVFRVVMSWPGWHLRDIFHLFPEPRTSIRKFDPVLMAGVVFIIRVLLHFLLLIEMFPLFAGLRPHFFNLSNVL